MLGGGQTNSVMIALPRSKENKGGVQKGFVKDMLPLLTSQLESVSKDKVGSAVCGGQ